MVLRNSKLKPLVTDLEETNIGEYLIVIKSIRLCGESLINYRIILSFKPSPYSFLPIFQAVNIWFAVDSIHAVLHKVHLR